MWWLVLGGLGAMAALVGKARQITTWKGWVWPVPVWNGRIPIITDKFQAVETADHRQHLGADIAFKKLPTDPKEVIQHDATAGFIAPRGTPILAAGPGRIWSTGVSDAMGRFVQIDHGAVEGEGVNSFYQHLESFAKDWQKGDEVRAGDLLGYMGYPPQGYHFRHLHFELWFPTRKRARDPAPYMRHWNKITLPMGVS